MTQSSPEDGTEDQRIVVVGPDGQPIGVLAAPGEDDDAPGEGSVTALVEQPAKVMRIGSMIKQLLEEVRTAPLDEASRAQLADIHRRSITELESGLAPELVEELERLSLPFTDDRVPSESELRIAQAQLEQMRRRALGPGGLPGGPGAPGDSGVPGVPAPGDERGGGLYL